MMEGEEIKRGTRQFAQSSYRGVLLAAEIHPPFGK